MHWALPGPASDPEAAERQQRAGGMAHLASPGSYAQHGHPSPRDERSMPLVLLQRPPMTRSDSVAAADALAAARVRRSSCSSSFVTAAALAASVSSALSPMRASHGQVLQQQQQLSFQGGPSSSAAVQSGAIAAASHGPGSQNALMVAEDADESPTHNLANHPQLAFLTNLLTAARASHHQHQQHQQQMSASSISRRRSLQLQRADSRASQALPTLQALQRASFQSQAGPGPGSGLGQGQGQGHRRSLSPEGPDQVQGQGQSQESLPAEGAFPGVAAMLQRQESRQSPRSRLSHQGLQQGP